MEFDQAESVRGKQEGWKEAGKGVSSAEAAST